MIAFCATPASHLDLSAMLRLVLMGRNPIGRARLFVMNDDGSQLRCLTERRPTASVLACIWSPDATQLLFRTQAGFREAYYVINVDGSDLRRLDLPTYHGRPFVIQSWLADRRLLLELVDRQTPAFTSPVALYTIQPDGSDLRYLTSVAGFAGQTLNARALLIPGPPPDFSLSIAARDGSNERPLTEHGQVLRMSHGSSPVWSPDGETVAFVVDDRSTQWLYSVRADGASLQRLSPIAFESPLVWSPNSRYLAFIALDQHNDVLYVADTAARQTHRLAEIEIPSAHGPRHALLAWSADSQSVVYVHAPQEDARPSIYRVRLADRKQALLVGAEADFEMISDVAVGPL